MEIGSVARLKGPGLVLALAAVFFLGQSVGPSSVNAHCDTLDGPVVKAAQAALEKGDVDLVLVWVRPEDEPEIRTAFNKTLKVRKLSKEAEEFADQAFFETLVRVHRAGEGASFTGLKAAGKDLGPALPLADKALQDGKLEVLEKLISQKAIEGLRERFKRVRDTANYEKADLKAGREHVEAYVKFVHFVERLHEAAASDAKGHPEQKPAEHENH